MASWQLVAAGGGREQNLPWKCFDFFPGDMNVKIDRDREIMNR